MESKDEIAQEKDYDVWSKALDVEKLWLAVVRTHKVDCISTVDEVKKLSARKAYQNIKQGAFETLAQYSERFRDTYRGYAETVQVQAGQVAVEEKVQAMEFFHGLDQGKYGAFKTSMLNAWTTGAVKPPTTVNEIYKMAGSWVKTSTHIDGGLASSFVTTIEEEARGKRTRGRNKNGGPKTEPKTEKPDEEPKKPKDLSHIECHRCHEMGHYANKCPQKKEQHDAMANAMWQEEQANMFHTMQADESIDEVTVDAVVNVTQGLLPTEVLLDTAADISVIHPMLLRDIHPADKKIRVKGVGGMQLIIDQKGTLDRFFPVYASESTKANVLSFGAVEEAFDITYLRREAFVVHTAEKDILFRRRDKLYVAEWYAEGIVETTVQENEILYSKEEIRRAKLAHEFIKNSGYPSVGEAVHLLTDGNVRGLPVITQADVERAYKIYGQHPEYVRGKMTKKTVGRVPVDPTLRSVEKNLRVYADVMHVDAKKFLITVCDPLNLTIQTKIENEGRTMLGMAL